MSKLTDLEICKRIAEIEGYTTKAHEGYKCCAVDEDNIVRFIPFDPLKNDDHCHRLMIKYSITFHKSELVDEDHFYTCCSTRRHNLAHTIYDTNPNKAICLAIIEAHKDS